ncbi:MAG: hypothetical protein ACI84C_001081 [Flavobacteriales bacterium]|jgi:hypothetical protein
MPTHLQQINNCANPRFQTVHCSIDIGPYCSFSRYYLWVKAVLSSYLPLASQSWQAFCIFLRMKTKILFLFVLGAIVATCGIAQIQEPLHVAIDTVETHDLRTIDNHSFRVGEKIKYTVHYGWMDAGEATLEVKKSPYTFNGREAYHIIGNGTSLGAFDWFFKVRDRYESHVDMEGLFPYHFVRNTDEGGYKIFQDYKFQPETSTMTTNDGDTLLTTDFIQDMMSAYYYTRNMDFTNVKKGDIFTVETIVDGKIYPMAIKFLKRETIKLRAGKFRCMKFAPVVQEGRIFKTEEDLSVWITDDMNKIPIMCESDLLFGSIKMEMTEWSGLANPMSKLD